jgi:hypothetical protein
MLAHRLEIRDNACAQARICAVHKSIAASRADIDAVLDLQTARGHNNTGVSSLMTGQLSAFAAIVL